MESPPPQTTNDVTPISLSDKRNPVCKNSQQILVLSTLQSALTHGVPASRGLQGPHVGQLPKLNYFLVVNHHTDCQDTAL